MSTSLLFFQPTKTHKQGKPPPPSCWRNNTMEVETHHLHLSNREFTGGMDNQMDIFHTQLGISVPSLTGNSSMVAAGLLQKKRPRGQEDEIFSFFQQQQNDQIDHLISQHMERVRMEVSERRRKLMRLIAVAAEEAASQRLKAKEDEIQRIQWLNAALQERLRCLSVENQVWREIAGASEAAATALRANLEEALQLQAQRHMNPIAIAADDDDAESCCDNYDLHSERDNDGDGGGGEEGVKKVLCRACGEEEPCVLLLPCRHLCLCSVCSAQAAACPICSCTKQCTVHINLS